VGGLLTARVLGGEERLHHVRVALQRRPAMGHYPHREPPWHSGPGINEAGKTIVESL
jgi:hypothetical protein